MAKLINVEHEDPLLSTFILFIQTAQTVLKYTDAYLYKKMRLSVSKIIVLQALAKASEGMIPTELAWWTSTERHNITTLINRMKREGLVTAERKSSNKKFVNITLTDKGREVYNQSMPVAREVFSQVMSSITEGDAALLKEKLTILRQNAYRGLEGSVNRANQPR
jgi:DNA-binding MarR family transcriptional regulator